MGIDRINALLDIKLFDQCADFLWGKKMPLVIPAADISRCIFRRNRNRFSESECELMAGGDFYVSAMKEEFANAANQCLIVRGNKICVCLEHYKEWRKIALISGQDVFVSALHGGRFGFRWNYSLPIESNQLDHALQEGYAENHCHFYLAGPSFDVNWMFLHNGPKFDGPIRAIEKKQKCIVNYYSEETYLLFKNLCFLSIYLRRYLYATYTKMKSRPELIGLSPFTLGDLRKPTYYSFAALLKEEIKRHYTFTVLGACTDYADTEGLGSAESGERQFLCRCFENYSSFDSTDQCVFYMYLMVKRYISGFFIQNNLYFGFNNFQRFERMSELFIPQDPRSKDFHNRSIFNALLENPGLRKLEIRTAPKNSKVKTSERMRSIGDAYGKLPASKPSIGLVVHFIKETNPLYRGTKRIEPRCFEKIKIYDRQLASIKALARGSASDFPLVGVDAANEEIRCRPEIFAPHYRELRNFEFRKRGAMYKPRIKFTFHVGEDFVTLADGLRAIDEAIEFLELHDGDRLGHASALGTDVEKYFALKGNKVIQTKQDALDDLCFLYRNCRHEESFYTDALVLREQAEILLLQIYGKSNFESYLRSICLRCDYPTVFMNLTKRATRYDSYLECCSKGHRFHMRVDGNKDYLEAWDDSEALSFIHLYHYSSKARAKADEINEFAIDARYKRCVKKAQENLAQRIKEKGIAIETNPTSNYLIGPFDDFEDIPTFSLLGVGKGKEFYRGISLTVGTDDPGLFGINLRNEYGSILYTLMKSYPSEGYLLTNIISALAKMSLDVSFVKTPSSVHD